MRECVRLVINFDQLSMFAGVGATSPSSVAEGLSDGALVKKAGRRGTKSATVQRALSDRKGKVTLIQYLWGGGLLCNVCAYAWA